MFDVEGFKQTTFKPRESKMTLEAFKEAGFGDVGVKRYEHK